MRYPAAMPAHSPSQSPLAKVMRARGIRQAELAETMGTGQSNISAVVVRGTRSRRFAERVLDAVDHDRKVLNELHLLYPERYPDWEMPPNGG